MAEILPTIILWFMAIVLSSAAAYKWTSLGIPIVIVVLGLVLVALIEISSNLSLLVNPAKGRHLSEASK